MKFIEFVEQFAEIKNINLLHCQKEVIKQISQAIEEGKEIKINCLVSSGKKFYSDLLKAKHKEIKEVKDDV
jgi:hypothetical protein